jgi:hypothetical protein
MCGSAHTGNAVDSICQWLPCHELLLAAQWMSAAVSSSDLFVLVQTSNMICSSVSSATFQLIGYQVVQLHSWPLFVHCWAG